MRDGNIFEFSGEESVFLRSRVYELCRVEQLPAGVALVPIALHHPTEADGGKQPKQSNRSRSDSLAQGRLSCIVQASVKTKKWN
jgi:hypothetical protein